MIHIQSDTAEEAAIAFDITCIKQKGFQAITNFDLRCYDVEAIFKADKLQKEKEVETTRPPLTITQKQNNTLGINIDIGSMKDRRPIIPDLNLRPQQAIPKSYHWAFEIAKKAHEASASRVSRFQHGTFSPFYSYQKMQQLKEQQEGISNFGFRHVSSSAFQSYKQGETIGNSSNISQKSYLESLLPYQINFMKKHWLRAQGLRFKHSSSSCFKTYKNNYERKGKSKMNPDS